MFHTRKKNLNSEKKEFYNEVKSYLRNYTISGAKKYIYLFFFLF